jgi:hypothetical protein
MMEWSFYRRTNRLAGHKPFQLYVDIEKKVAWLFLNKSNTGVTYNKRSTKSVLCLSQMELTMF